MSTILEEMKRVRDFAVKKMNEMISREEAKAESHGETTTFVEEKIAEEVAEGEVVAKETVSPPEPKATKPHPAARKGRNGELNKSEIIREYFKRHPDAGNQEVIDYLKEKHGIQAYPSLVSTVKFHMRKKVKPSAKTVSKPAAKVRERRGDAADRRGRSKFPKGRVKGGINRSELVREYLAKHRDAGAGEVISHLKDKHATSVTPALVYSIKAKMPKRGRKPDSDKGEPMVACVMKALAKLKEGAKLKDVAKFVKKSGKYHYAGSKGEEGFLYTVYQALHALHQSKKRRGWEGRAPVVLHDKENHTWKLNPNAKREFAA